MQELHEELVQAQPAPLTTPDPSAIMQVGTGFWASKTLLAAIKLRLFTLLNDRDMTAEEIRQELDLHPRSLYDFLDALHALKFLNREGTGKRALYSNTTETAFFLDRNKPSYIGGLLEMCNDRLYPFWGTLEEGLKTGKPQNEIKHEGIDANPFDAFYADPDRLTQFMEAMAGIQMGAFTAFARLFDFSRYQTLTDIGGATGLLSIQVALNNPHIQCITFDLPAVEHIARKWVERFDAAARVRIQSGDFFTDDFPKADVITMGNILHDWGYADKLMLASKAYEALPEGGAFVVIEGIIDDERKENAFGLLMSLNMLIETQAGYDFTFHDFQELATEAGFSRFELIHLAGPTSAAIAYK
ncbi:MAG TPA: methyltransferase [Flavisolibacter sp.]|nr:methyltransferase [Flavisolibacter sp.]